MSSEGLIEIVEMAPEAAEDAVGALAETLHACVHGGASVGFVLPFSMADAEAFWRGSVLPGVASGGRTLLGAYLDGVLVGTGQLSCETMPNQRHRGEVCKLLVHPRARRLGIARRLMDALEARARLRGLTLLTLDTRTGDAAEPLYLSLGYQMVGQIPAYARATEGEALDATSVMFKLLD